MLLLGLTGSIATGKSTVSRILSSPPYSLPIIDADVIAREVVAPGTPAYAKIVAHFAATTPDLLLSSPTSSSTSAASTSSTSAETETGAGTKPEYPKGAPLNRPALGRRVFGTSPERIHDRGVLNRIVHPAVRRALYLQLLSYYIRGHWAVVLDVPLLFESGMDVLCGMVVVVGIRDVREQVRRLRVRDGEGGMTEEEAWDRVKSQGDVREKAKRCEARGKGRGVVVWNDGGVEELKGEVERLVGEMRSVGPRWWAWLLWLCPPWAGLMALWTVVRGWGLKRRWERGEEGRVKAKL